MLYKLRIIQHRVSGNWELLLLLLLLLVVVVVVVAPAVVTLGHKIFKTGSENVHSNSLVNYSNSFQCASLSKFALLQKYCSR